MLSHLVSKQFLNKLKENDTLINTQLNNNILQEPSFFDNDFFYTLFIILLIVLFLTYILYTKRIERNKYNCKKNIKLFNNIKNYCEFVKKTDYLKNLNNY